MGLPQGSPLRPLWCQHPPDFHDLHQFEIEKHFPANGFKNHIRNPKADTLLSQSGLTRALLGTRTPTPPGLRRRRPPPPAERAQRAQRDPINVRVKRLTPKADAQDADDVIDLGAPRLRRATPAPRPRRRCFYTPNPRLYPGPERKIQFATVVKRQHGRVFRRAAPNPRLYRPVVKPPPPPAVPRAPWPAPPPARALDTASRAALRLATTRPPSPPPAKTQPSKSSKATGRNSQPRSTRAHRPAPRPRRLVVKLPAAGDVGDTYPQYRPVSEHFRARTAPGGLPSGATSPTARPPMDAYRSSPDDASDGNDSLSAPSEFLAEFLSAIMQRQYAEALKYCRLILQYEPDNATARGFYPLLQQKLSAPERPRARRADSEPSSGSLDEAATMPRQAHEAMDQSPESASPSRSRGRSGSSGSATIDSLELDSSPARSDSPSGSGWDLRPGSGLDDNGNLPTTHTCACDADNNSPRAPSPRAASSPRAPRHSPPKVTRVTQSEESSASLRRLRAQFACSIK